MCFTQYPDGPGTILFNILGILAGRMAHLPRGPKSDRLWICRNLADQHPSTFQSRYFERWLCQRVGELGSRQLSTFGPKDQNVFVPMIDLQNTGANCFRPYDRPPKQRSIIFSIFPFLNHFKFTQCDVEIKSKFPFYFRISHFIFGFSILFSDFSFCFRTKSPDSDTPEHNFMFEIYVFFVAFVFDSVIDLR